MKPMCSANVFGDSAGPRKRWLKQTSEDLRLPRRPFVVLGFCLAGCGDIAIDRHWRCLREVRHDGPDFRRVFGLADTGKQQTGGELRIELRIEAAEPDAFPAREEPEVVVRLEAPLALTGK